MAASEDKGVMNMLSGAGTKWKVLTLWSHELHLNIAQLYT